MLQESDDPGDIGVVFVVGPIRESSDAYRVPLSKEDCPDRSHELLVEDLGVHTRRILLSTLAADLDS
jgi:hypothetical protein